MVDNEETDRELLVHLLAPLGFELRTAASGHDALDLLAAGFRPHAMFVDLAMPGIDGWETLRRARAFWEAGDGGGRPAPGRPKPDAAPSGGSEDTQCRAWGPATAIVSANAFDKRLENDVGITPEDFFVKPVRHSELLDWLERRLQLRWTDAPAMAAQPPAAEAPVAPSPERLRALEEAVQLGYLRGIMKQLDEIDAAQPACAAWTAQQRTRARQFQFEAMAEAIRRAGAAPESVA